MNIAATASVNLAEAIEQIPELATLMSTPPIVFQRLLVDVAGAVLPALILSECIEQNHNQQLSDSDWFELDVGELRFQTGMTVAEQQSGYRQLIRGGLVKERVMPSCPDQIFLQIDYSTLIRELLRVAREHQQRKLKRNDEGSTHVLPLEAHVNTESKI